MIYSKSPIFQLFLCKNITAVFIFGFLVVIAMLQTVYYSNSKVTMSPLAWRHFQVPFYSFMDDSDTESTQYRKMYNLMNGYPEPVKECTLDYVNTHKVAQDHPCVLDLIRSKFIDVPVPSAQQRIQQFTGNNIRTFELEKWFKNKTNGIFLECGAYDGEFLSNTLSVEMKWNWTGLLIEANPVNYEKLLKKGRNAWTVPLCLSPYPYPTKVLFVDSNDGKNSASLHIVETDKKGEKLYDKKWDRVEGQMNQSTIEVQCFPLYSILLASNFTTIDYLSLDIEGFEIKILKTIPWQRVDVATLQIEWLKIQPTEDLTSEQVLAKYMEEEANYIKFSIHEWDAIYFSRRFWNENYFEPVQYHLDTWLS